MRKYEVGEVRDGILFIEEGEIYGVDTSEFNEGDKLYLDSDMCGCLVTTRDE